MIYLDNAATSRFKPKSALDALNFDVLHSANSGRSGHNEAIRASMRIESCRNFLKCALGADDSYEIIFTKNCTEALNLAIFGSIKDGDTVVTSKNEHNSVLRPLFQLKKQGRINLIVLPQDKDGKISLKDVSESAKIADVLVLGGACNVTGATLDVAKAGRIAKENNAKLIVDGAQSVPVIEMNVAECGADMLACPAHKGLHGVQGVGFLIVKKDIPLIPLTYGGTGTFSEEVLPQLQMPESYEAGTMFTGGISALHQGAKWSFENVARNRKNLIRLSENTIYNLKHIGATVYTKECECGIVSFNVRDVDSAFIADKLNEYDVCVRSGLHCAPLVHDFLNTTNQGAVRVSFGCDSTDNDVLFFSKAMEHIVKNECK